MHSTFFSHFSPGGVENISGLVFAQIVRVGSLRISGGFQFAALADGKGDRLLRCRAVLIEVFQYLEGIQDKEVLEAAMKTGVLANL